MVREPDDLGPRPRPLRRGLDHLAEDLGLEPCPALLQGRAVAQQRHHLLDGAPRPGRPRRRECRAHRGHGGRAQPRSGLRLRPRLRRPRPPGARPRRADRNRGDHPRPPPRQPPHREGRRRAGRLLAALCADRPRRRPGRHRLCPPGRRDRRSTPPPTTRSSSRPTRRPPFDHEFRANWPEGYGGEERPAIRRATSTASRSAWRRTSWRSALAELANIAERRVQMLLDRPRAATCPRT